MSTCGGPLELGFALSELKGPGKEDRSPRHVRKLATICLRRTLGVRVCAFGS